MQVLYERYAAVDVGKDVIAVAVRLPGGGRDGRRTVKRTFRTFYGVLREMARCLVSEGVTHVAIEATGVYSLPVYHALLEHGDFEQVLVCNAAHVKNVPGRKTDLLTELFDVSAVQGADCQRCGTAPTCPERNSSGWWGTRPDPTTTRSGHTLRYRPPAFSSLLLAAPECAE